MYAEKPYSDKKRRQDTPLASRQRPHQTRVALMAKPSPAPLAGKAPLLNPGLGVMQPKAMPFWAPAYSEKPHDPAQLTVQLEKKPSATLATPSQPKPSALEGAQAAAIALSRGSPVKSLLAGIATLSVAYLAPEVVKSVIQAIDDHPDLNPFQKETLKLYVYTMSVIQPDLFEGKKEQSEGNKNTNKTTLPIAEQRPTSTPLPIAERTPTTRSLPALDKDTLDYILHTPIADKINASTQSIGKGSDETSLGAVYSKLRDEDTILSRESFKKTGIKVKGAIVYKGADGKYYHRDTLHIDNSSELEVYNRFGEHIGIADPKTGKIDKTKKKKGRRINVK